MVKYFFSNINHDKDDESNEDFYKIQLNRKNYFHFLFYIKISNCFLYQELDMTKLMLIFILLGLFSFRPV
jgi:hypothetical protein